MAEVTETLTTDGTTPVGAGHPVTAHLAVVGYTGTVTIVGAAKEAATVTAADGSWTLDLEPNVNITPADTYWVVTRRGGAVAIVVPDTAGPHQLADLLVDTPTAPDASALQVHAANASHLPAPGTAGQVLTSDGTAWTASSPAEATHPDLAAHDALGLATQAELDAHAATPHGSTHPDLASHDALGLATDAEVTAALEGKADLVGGVVPDGQLPAGLTRDSELTAAVQAAIDGLLAGAPGALDTLDELAAAIGDDANFAATVTAALAGKQAASTELTALAALTSTTFGRSLLELASAAAGRAALDVPSTAEVIASYLPVDHENDTTNVHGITDTAALVLTDDARLTDARPPTAHSHNANPPLSDATPQPTGIATPGVATSASRADHVHGSAGGGVTPTQAFAAALPAVGAYLFPYSALSAQPSGASGGLWMVPVSPTRNCACTACAIEVTTAQAGGLLRLGIYSADDTTRMPKDLLQTFGAVDCSTTGVKTVAISPALQLVGGTLYWLAALGEHSGAVPSFRTVIHTSAGLTGFPQTSTNPLTQHRSGLYAIGVPTGSLPAVAPSGVLFDKAIAQFLSVSAVG